MTNHQPVVVARNLEIILRSISLIFYFVQPITNSVHSILTIALYSTFSFAAQIRGTAILFPVASCPHCIMPPASTVAEPQLRLQAANGVTF